MSNSHLPIPLEGRDDNPLVSTLATVAAALIAGQVNGKPGSGRSLRLGMARQGDGKQYCKNPIRRGRYHELPADLADDNIPQADNDDGPFTNDPELDDIAVGLKVPRGPEVADAEDKDQAREKLYPQ